MVFELGDRLRELRDARGLTQVQVAKLLHTSHSTINGYENAHKMPSIDRLRSLAAFYNVSADYLIGLDNRSIIRVEGLTDRQIEIVNELIAEFLAKK